MNDKDELLYRVSAGYGIGENPENITLPNELAIVMVGKSAYTTLHRALNQEQENKKKGLPYYTNVTATLIPHECKVGKAQCSPLLDKEKELIQNLHLDSGKLLTTALMEQTKKKYEALDTPSNPSILNSNENEEEKI